MIGYSWRRHYMGLFSQWLECKLYGHIPKMVHRRGFLPSVDVCQRCGKVTKDPSNPRSETK